MNKTEVMKTLESLGTTQNCKTYTRHGVTDKLFGVSYANFYKLQKAIGVDQKLAEQLWDTEIHDARILATLITDPATITVTTINNWLKTVNNYIMSDALARGISRSPHACECFEKWITKTKDEWVCSTGWNLLGLYAGQDINPLLDVDNAYFKKYLAVIEADIPKSLNRVKHSMNAALISIGVRNAELQKAAIQTAKRIGKIEVDHGQTNCKTPDAAIYIIKTMERLNKKHKNKKTVK